MFILLKNATISSFLCVLFVACAQTVDLGIDKEISISESNGVQYEIDDIVGEYEWLCLKKQKNVALGKIDKVLFYKNDYYILDKTKNKAIFVYDSKGNYKRMIGVMGKGHGEYAGIKDAVIDEKQQKIVFLAMGNEAYVYSLKGKFVSKYSLGNTIYESIAVCPNGYICSTGHMSLTKEGKAKLFTFFDRKFHEQTREYDSLPYSIFFPPIISSCFQTVGTSLYYINIPTYHIYKMDLKDKNSNMLIGINLFNSMPTEKFKRVEMFNKEFMKYSFIKDVVITRNHIIIAYVDKGHSCMAIGNTTETIELNGALKIFIKNMFYNDKDDFIYTPIDYIDYKNEWVQRFPIKGNDNVKNSTDALLLKWRIRDNK